MTNNTSPNTCVGVTKDGKAHNSPALETIQVRERSGKAYLPEKFPHTDAGWGLVEIPVCGNCLRALKSKVGCLNVKYLNTNTSKEDTMKNNEFQHETLDHHYRSGGAPMFDLFGDFEDDEPYDGPGYGDILPGGASMGEFAFEKHYTPADFEEEYPDECEDAEVNKANAIKELHGRPYEQRDCRGGSHILVEKCSHDDCEAEHQSSLHEVDMIGEQCCGKTGDDCPHFYVWLCLHHPDIRNIPGAVKHNLPKLTSNEGQAKQYHATMQQVGAHIDKLNREGFAGVKFFKTKNHAEKGKGFWVYWIYDLAMTQRPNVKKATFDNVEPKKVKCGHCSHWENGKQVEVYHASTDEVKACYAKANADKIRNL